MWGATLGGGAYVARSAIGQDAVGDLVYAASMSAVPADLAAALVGHGARIAMELDINPEWVQLDATGMPGGALTAEIPGQYRPSNQYLTGWTRDFFTVLARPPVLGAPRRLLPASGRNEDAVLASSQRCGAPGRFQALPGLRWRFPGAGPTRGRAGHAAQDRSGGWLPVPCEPVRTHRPAGSDGGRTPQTMPASAATG